MSLLMGLNDTYASVRGQFLLMDPIPSLSKVFSLLLQDEKQRKLGKRLYTESSALAIKINASSIKGFNKCKSGRRQCTHCGILGHVVDKCYKFHGVHNTTKAWDNAQVVESGSYTWSGCVQGERKRWLRDFVLVRGKA